MKNLLFFLALTLLLAACKTDTATTDDAIEAANTAAAVQEGARLTADKAEITLTPKEPGEYFPSAEMKSMDYENGIFKFDVAGDAYELGQQTPDAQSTMCANSGKGQHIHLIVDNKPYAAKYEPTFEYELKDGMHRILAFLSRSYHESIKTEAAHKAVNATIKDGTMVNATPIDEMMLFYSRPKGTYVGKDAEKLLLDFYPVGVTLGAEAKVKVETNGKTFMLDKWQPYVLEGLPMGENTVTLSLVDGEGKLIKAPFNPVSRTFTLKADPLSE